MSTEAAFWNTLRKRMVPKHWPQATRHEEAYQKGVADVSFVQDGLNGWIELKNLTAWPVRPKTIVKFSRYTQDQKDFLRAKGEHTGMAFLLAKIDRDYLLWDWEAAQDIGTLNTADTIESALVVMKGKLNPVDLCEGVRMAYHDTRHCGTR